ncbi:MAG: GAF domain-containing protein [Bacteroidetes bacterium]|nr:MAG: GAF domain-containing protein [Bacteroidota bacterium]
MAETLKLTAGLDRRGRYEELLPQLQAVIAAEDDLIANMANMAAMLKTAFDFHWVGFYRAQGQLLILGPFQGPLACTRIDFGRGVCGTAAAQRQSIIVPDVEQFPGHIACSSLSRSEIVVPLVVDGHTRLVLDVDSDQPDDFSELDAHFLAEMVQLLARHF